MTAGSLYLAGFAQAGALHAALLLVTSSAEGYIFHITTKSGIWAFNGGMLQKIQGSLSLISLIKICDVSKGTITKEDIEEIVRQVNVPASCQDGECLVWICGAVNLLTENGLVTLTSVENLVDEFSTFCAVNRSYTTSSKYPNVKTSSYCA